MKMLIFTANLLKDSNAEEVASVMVAHHRTFDATSNELIRPASNHDLSVKCEIMSIGFIQK